MVFKRECLKISQHPRAACLVIGVLISSRFRGKVWWGWSCVGVRVSWESKDVDQGCWGGCLIRVGCPIRVGCLIKVHHYGQRDASKLKGFAQGRNQAGNDPSPPPGVRLNHSRCWEEEMGSHPASAQHLERFLPETCWEVNLGSDSCCSLLLFATGFSSPSLGWMGVTGRGRTGILALSDPG